MTGAAIDLVTPGARDEAFSANNMKAVVADVIPLSRVEAGFAWKGVKGF